MSGPPRRQPAAAGPPGAESLVLRAGREGSATARAFVATVLGRHGVEVPDGLLLLTSEAASNVDVHADSDRLTVSVEHLGSAIRISVHDDDPSPPVLVAFDPSRAGGLGVRLIDELAADWGVTQVSGDGKVVWFEVPI